MATIAEKSRTKEVIDRLQSILNNASPVPLAAGKVTVYKDEMQTLLEELAMLMDAELKTYHEVNDRKGKIINEAKKEAERIIRQAERTASRMRVTKRSTNVSPLDYDALSDEDLYALSNADEIYGASLIYTDEMLTEVSKVVEDAYHNIRNDYEIVMQVLEDKMNTINSNKEELMSGLQEMDGEERSQQILEIGQLLSQELYNERLKQRVNSDEYDDGSVQLTLDLQLEQAEENARQAEEMARQTTEALEQMTAERNALMETVMEMERAHAQVQQDIEMGAAANSKKQSQLASNTQQPEQAEMVQSEAEDEDEEYEEYEIVYVTEDELEDGEEYEIEYVDEEEYEAYEAARKGKTVVEEQAEPESQEKAEDIEEAEEQVELEHQVDLKEQAKAEQQVEAQKQAKLEHQVEMKEQADGKSQAEPKKQADTENQPELKKQTDLKDSDMPVVPHFKSSEKITSAPSEQIAKMAKAVTTEKKYSGLISRAVANREKEEAAVTVEETDDMPISPQRSGKRGPVVTKPDTTSAKTDKVEKPDATFAKTDKAEKPETTFAKLDKVEKSETVSAKTEKAEQSDTTSAKIDKVEKPDTSSAKSDKGEGNTATSSGSKTNKGRKRKKAAAKAAEKKDEDIKTDAQGNQYVEATMQYEDPYEITEF
jgi:hypothetical protein